MWANTIPNECSSQSLLLVFSYKCKRTAQFDKVSACIIEFGRFSDCPTGFTMLPEEIKSLAGQVYCTSTFDIDRESIRRFALAVGDMNPLYHDAKYAANTRYGSIIAPPGFISSIWFWEDHSPIRPDDDERRKKGLLGLIFDIADAGYPSAIDSSIDYEFILPVKAGDTITSTLVIKDIRERNSEEGSLVFLITDTEYVNQKGETVAMVRMTTIHR